MDSGSAVVATSDPADVVCDEASLPPRRAFTPLASEQKIEPMGTGSGPKVEVTDIVKNFPSGCVPSSSLNAWQTTSELLIGMPEADCTARFKALGMAIAPPSVARVPKGMSTVLASSPELDIPNLRIICPARGTKL